MIDLFTQQRGAAPTAPIVPPPPKAKRPRSIVGKNEIIELREYLVRMYQGRNDDFRTLVNAYHGNYYLKDEIRWNMDASGKLLLRAMDGAQTAMPMTVNVLKGYADAYKKMLVGLPDIRIPTPYGRFKTQEENEKYTATMKRAAYGIWDASDMALQQVEAAWWHPVCGSHGSVVLPDFERGHAIIKYTAPWSIYGIPKQGNDFRLARCIVTAYEDPYRVKAEYPDLPGVQELVNSAISAAGEQAEAAGMTRGIQHTIYLDEGWFIRMIGDTIVGQAYHGLDFCPALIPPFILLPEYTNRGHSAIEQSLPMQLSMNYGFSLWEEGMKDSVFRTTYVVDPQNVPAGFQRGKGQVITVNPGGSIGEIGGDPQAIKIISDHFHLMREAMDMNTGVNRTAMNGSPGGGGTLTGRGAEKAASPYVAAIEEIQTVQAEFKSMELAYAFAMTGAHEMWEETADDEVTFSGLMKGVPVYEKVRRGDLVNVPKPEMIYSPMAHLGLHERVNIGLQLFNSKPPLLSWEAMVYLHSLVRDIPELRMQIESDQKWREQNMQREAAAMQPQPQQPPGGGAGGGNPEDAAAALQAGATNPQTMRRAGVTQTAQVPAGGAPSGPAAAAAANGAPGGAGDPLAALAGGPEPAAANPAPALDAPIEQQIAGELSTLELKGDVYVAGDRVLVDDWQDIAQVRKRIGHHKDLKVKVAKKKPQGATLVAKAGGKVN